jgi:hypothetical protein
MNKLDLIIANLKGFKRDLYGFNGPRPHTYLAFRLAKYLNSEPLICSIIEEWKEQIVNERKRAQDFYSRFKLKLTESGLIPPQLMENFNKMWKWTTEEVKFIFPDRFTEFAKNNNLCALLDFDLIFIQMKNPNNIPSEKKNCLNNYRFALVDLVESDEYLTSELKWLRSSLNYHVEIRVGKKKMLEFYYYFSDPLEIARNNIHLNTDDYREISLGIIDELTQEFQSRNLVNYWLNRYCQRSQHFNHSFYQEIKQTIKADELTEDICCQHLLLYLFDKGIDFSYNAVKQGFRPDVDLTNSVIEVKYIREDNTVSMIRNAIETAITEVYQQSESHPSIRKYILVYSANKRYKIVDCKFDDIIFKTVDFGIALYDDSPSKSKRELLKPSEVLKKGD